MSELNRRDFLKIAGAGSAILAAVGSGVVAKGSVLHGDHAATDGAPLTFRATAGLPQRPYPAYASLVVDGSVDPSARSGTIRRAVYAGAPDAMSDVVFPGTERSYRVTDVTATGDRLLVSASVADAATLEAGEPSTIHVRVDRRTGAVEAPFTNTQRTLTA